MGVSPRPQPERLAEKLLEIRNRLDVSQEKLAEIMAEVQGGIVKGSISRFESGGREPSLPVLLRYARLIKVPVDVLIDDKLNLPR